MGSDVMVVAEDVVKRYRKKDPLAVDRVSLRVRRGESLGIVGETGSGKSTMAKILSGLLPHDEGRVEFDGRPIYRRGRVDREIWKRVQMIFQDPYESLNPAMDVGTIVGEPLLFWRGLSAAQARTRVAELLEGVGLAPTVAKASPEELSGGQRQRVSIARAMAAEPELIICDEPVAALDVSVQAQILALMNELRERQGVAYVFISHDIGVVQLMCDRIAVMNAGRVVEELDAADMSVDRATDPYTRRLLASVPTLPHVDHPEQRPG